tara:strand:+ start:3152 stop:4243 length:1092 start_codon:yes stop_codon:yes gene_type:complete
MMHVPPLRDDTVIFSLPIATARPGQAANVEHHMRWDSKFAIKEMSGVLDPPNSDWYLHHLTFFSVGSAGARAYPTQLFCPEARRFAIEPSFANDRTPWESPWVVPGRYGVLVEQGETWMVSMQLVNLRDVADRHACIEGRLRDKLNRSAQTELLPCPLAQSAANAPPLSTRLRMRLRVVRPSSPDWPSLIPARGYCSDVKQNYCCLGSYNVPARQCKSAEDECATVQSASTAPLTAALSIVAIVGHTHPSGRGVRVRIDDRAVCEITPGSDGVWPKMRDWCDFSERPLVVSPGSRLHFAAAYDAGRRTVLGAMGSTYVLVAETEALFRVGAELTNFSVSDAPSGEPWAQTQSPRTARRRTASR